MNNEENNDFQAYGANYNYGYSFNNSDYNNSGNNGEPKKKKQKPNSFIKFIALVCMLSLCFGSGYIVHYFSSRPENIIDNVAGAVSQGNGDKSTAPAENTTKDKTQNNTAENILKVTSSEETMSGDVLSIIDIVDKTANTVVEITTEYRATAGFGVRMDIGLM